MKTCNLLFCGFAGVLTSGCSLKMAGPPAATANVPSLTESTELTVPLPAQTPFDKNPKAKAAYLEYFAMGYRLAATDSEYTSLGCMCAIGGDAERYEASVSGFFAGKEAGSVAFAARRQQHQAPATATSDAPTMPPPSRQ